MFRSLTRRLALATAAALLPAPLVAAAPDGGAPEPERTVLAPLFHSADPIPGQYLVTLDAGFDPARIARGVGAEPSFVYQAAVLGFAAPLTDAQVTAVRRAPGVAAVEQDARVQLNDPLPLPRPAAPAAPWGLDRIDQRELPLDGGYSVGSDGSGVTAYVMDTGIDYDHSEFGGRAEAGFDAVGDGRDGADCNGHGTHVAGTVGGGTYGVARNVSLVSVRVLNCEGLGSTGGIIAGLDWTARNAEKPAVLNASLGGGYSYATNAAVDNLARAGVLPVVAAGNSDRNACSVSPAGADSAVTVGATRRDDDEAQFSNHGSCVDLYAPGVDIVSAQLGGGSVALNGTSMAAPHVAGVAALHQQESGGTSAAALARLLTRTATPDQVGNIGPGSPNRLLFTGSL
ncbi:S8 family peptidase [Streptomyces sp. GSL17-111]|uniref:S8 family peptidase n=1 Tax=Streptomyces sp. GSL17-111 TaxID=3121596 RepID=UPI0030F4132C